MAKLGASASVLVYEDDAVCAQAFAAALRQAGHTVQITSHFQPALAALEADLPIDILLADVIFPDGGVNGMALARMALVKRPTLKVMYVTGHDLDGVARSAHGPILRKPVPDEALHFWVQRALAKSHEFWWL